ncbi:MAG: phospho-N-acetylmuramoyl-pentapeptide-transferase [Clostridia bacterium]|nr:phospho-N-acetylmuramoyl-pentapeptide-transferase [Clostridia bacterium]
MKTYLSGFLTSLILAIIIGFAVIPLLKKLKFGQNILNYVTEHNYKSGTPTMGGVIFIASAIIGFIIFAKPDKYLSTVCITVGLSYMAVGFIDDFIKIKLKRNKGLSAIQKTVFELIIAVIISIFALTRGLTKVYLPFFNFTVDLGFAFIPVCVLVFVATTNSVNLTDGLDGLASGVTYIVLLTFGTIILLQTKTFANNYTSVVEYENVALLLFTLAGGLVGYLLFNTHKASVFMGDTGSLALGGFVAITSIVSGNLLFVPIVGITYALSSISVIVQVVYYKKTKKRVFLMAPIHHHFQHKGFDEGKIAVGYKLLTLILGLICVISYL